MNEGTYTMVQREKLQGELAGLQQDLDEVLTNIGKVLTYMEALPDDPLFDAVRLRVKTLLNVRPVSGGGEHVEIFNIELAEGLVEIGSNRDRVEEEELIDEPLIAWGARMEKLFNDMTVESGTGLRKLAAREALNDGDVHESSAPGDG